MPDKNTRSGAPPVPCFRPILRSSQFSTAEQPFARTHPQHYVPTPECLQTSEPSVHLEKQMWRTYDERII